MTKSFPKIDTSFYEQCDFCKKLMVSRGIIQKGENIEAAFERVISKLFSIDNLLEKKVDLEFLHETIELIEDGILVFGTPILSNVGRPGMTSAAAMVLELPVKNNQLDIGHFAKEARIAFSNAIGVGFDLSNLKDPVRDLLKMNSVVNIINKELIASNKRPVACMATLRVNHSKILDFIKAKRDVDFKTWRFNISVFLTEDFFKKSQKNQAIELFDHKLKKTGSIRASQVLEEIADNIHYCAEPGILFIDRFEKDNPTPQWPYLSTAPCAESAMSPNELCQFSYINLFQLVSTGSFDRKKFKQAVFILTRLLDDSVEVSLQSHPFDAKIVAQKRRIGISITGFAEMLLKLKLPYASKEAGRLAHEIAEMLDFYSKSASVALAQRRGSFPSLNKSKYLDQNWVKRKDDKAGRVIDKSDWRALYQKIAEFGIRNAATVVFPPTGTSSLIVGTTTSFEPFYSLIAPNGKFYRSVDEFLKNKKKLRKKIKEQGSFLPHIDSNHVLATARQIPYQYHLRIQAIFQNFSDESSSKTINLHQTASKEDVLEALWQAYDLNLKGLSLFRDNCLLERKN